MLNNLLLKYLPKSYHKEVFNIVFFGLLSLLFAHVKFHVTGYEEIDSNFREIPLLISLFYIRNPIYLIGLSLITIVFTPEGIPYTLNFGFHVISLLVAWFLYFYSKKVFKDIVVKLLVWVLIVYIYYAVLIIPSFLGIGYLIGFLPDLNFSTRYYSFYQLLEIEGLTTTLVTGLYLMQYENRKALLIHKQNLENTVEKRTEELALANKSLTYVNENLDDLVKERSRKIEEQLNIIARYAHMNSHEVRAPISRIIGLLSLIKIEDDLADKKFILRKLNESARELDTVVKRMNRLLEEEIPDDEAAES